MCLFGLWLPGNTVVAQPINSNAVDAILGDALKAWQVPGVTAAIVRGDEVLYLKGFGVRELGGTAAVTPDTLFPLASCTKAFTSTAMAMLVDEGKMNWDDPVRKYVPYFHLSDPLADAGVTLRDLVCHRTGLSGHDLLWYRSPWSREEIIRRVGRAPLKHSFRSTFQYQSIMFVTAGAAVEAAAQMKWEDFIQQRLFDPLGMKSACCTTTAAAKVADRAMPHRANAKGELEMIPWYPLPQPDPSGSVNATARDLAKWLQFQLGDGTFRGRRLLSAKNLAETHAPQMIIPYEGSAKDMNPYTHLMNYGMGWVLQDYRGQFLISHAGAIDGFRAHLTLIPDAKLGIVLLNNRHGTGMNLAISNQLVDLLQGLPRKDWNKFYVDQVHQGEAAALARWREREARRRPGTKPSHELAAYAGAYEDPVYGTAKIMLENGTLVWHWNAFTARLEHFQDDTFATDLDFLNRPQVQFILDKDGAVIGMKFLEALEAEFKKVKP